MRKGYHMLPLLLLVLQCIRYQVVATADGHSQVESTTRSEGHADEKSTARRVIVPQQCCLRSSFPPWQKKSCGDFVSQHVESYLIPVESDAPTKTAATTQRICYSYCDRTTAKEATANRQPFTTANQQRRNSKATAKRRQGTTKATAK